MIRNTGILPVFTAKNAMLRRKAVSAPKLSLWIERVASARVKRCAEA
jgi:hypothetical protein